MRFAAFACVLVAGLAAAAPAGAQRATPPRAPVLSELPVDGTTIRRMQASTTIRAPFEAVARRLLDYAHYPEFLPRFRAARVVRRDRAQTDVYFQLELPRAMGVVWFVHRMTVVRRSPDRLEIQGVAQSGNAGRVETLAVIERVPSARATRFSFTLFGVPTIPALPDAVNDALRDAVRATAVLFQDRAEHELVGSNL